MRQCQTCCRHMLYSAFIAPSPGKQVLHRAHEVPHGLYELQRLRLQLLRGAVRQLRQGELAPEAIGQLVQANPCHKDRSELQKEIF